MIKKYREEDGVYFNYWLKAHQAWSNYWSKSPLWMKKEDYELRKGVIGEMKNTKGKMIGMVFLENSTKKS